MEITENVDARTEGVLQIKFSALDLAGVRRLLRSHEQGEQFDRIAPDRLRHGDELEHVEPPLLAVLS